MRINYSTLLASILLPAAIAAENVPLTPPDAKPGECYAKVVIPAKYEDVEEKVLVKEAAEKIEIIPAKYDTVKAEIEVVPQTNKLIPIPATYKDVTETIEIKPAYKVWKTSLKDDAALVSPFILSAVEAAGINIKNAQPGECFKEYYTPRKFKKVTEEILVQAESNETEVIPPEFETVEKTITIKPASKELVEVPAVYEEVEEKILIAPERTVWKKGENPAQKVAGATGEIMCLVNIPAKYKTVKKKVLKEPAKTEVVDTPPETQTLEVKRLISDYKINYTPVDPVYITVEKTELEEDAKFVWQPAKDQISDEFRPTGYQVCLTEEPAEYLEVTKKVLETPARVETEVVPAVTETIDTKELVAEAQVVKTPIEEEYKTITKKQKISDEQIAWKRILCQTNMNKDVVKRIQEALNEKGYEAGEPDGLLGRGTKSAIDQFQRENNLATGGITYETLNALGIKLGH